jgi:hypothetical protein
MQMVGLSQLGWQEHVCTWHLADNSAAPAFVRFWTRADKGGVTPGCGLSPFDPSATLVVHCGDGFDIDFSPYQSTRLSR